MKEETHLRLAYCQAMRQCGRPPISSGFSDLSLVSSAVLPTLRNHISHLLLPSFPHLSLPSIPFPFTSLIESTAHLLIAMHLVLTGATGLVGSAVLQQMLVTPSVSKVSILSRRPVAQVEGHSKARVIIHKDYATYPPELLNQLKDVDGVVWAQGISSISVSKPYFPSPPSRFQR
jgi:hypothetical protein